MVIKLAVRRPAGSRKGRKIDDRVQCPLATWVREVADDRADSEVRPPVMADGRRRPS